MYRLTPIRILIVALAITTCPIPALAQFINLHNFGDGTVLNDGTNGSGPLVPGPDGDLYSVASSGGSQGDGVIFKTTRQGQVTILHSFLDGTVPHDGYDPVVLVRDKDGTFYGITTYGGTTSTITSGYGTFFKASAKGKVTILHNFGDGAVNNDAVYPSTLILGKDGDFYGTAPSDLAGSMRASGVTNGLIFRINKKGKVTILHRFGKDGDPKDGAYPTGILQAEDGNFYGTTLYGGSADPVGNGFGTIFRMTSVGKVTTLHSFEDGTTVNDGQFPAAGLIQSCKGIFYGTTEFGGGDSYGVLFQMTKEGVVTSLHSFGDGTTPNDGLRPVSILAESWNGNLYGTTPFGGSVDGGTIFKYTPAGKFEILHNFGDGTVTNDGVNPFGPLTFLFDGYLFGTTTAGGSAGLGTIFKFPHALKP